MIYAKNFGNFVSDINIFNDLHKTIIKLKKKNVILLQLLPNDHKLV